MALYSLAMQNLAPITHNHPNNLHQPLHRKAIPIIDRALYHPMYTLPNPRALIQIQLPPQIAKAQFLPSRCRPKELLEHHDEVACNLDAEFDEARGVEESEGVDGCDGSVQPSV